jgi:hypothetical protein
VPPVCPPSSRGPTGAAAPTARQKYWERQNDEAEALTSETARLQAILSQVEARVMGTGGADTAVEAQAGRADGQSAEMMHKMNANFDEVSPQSLAHWMDGCRG